MSEYEKYIEVNIRGGLKRDYKSGEYIEVIEGDHTYRMTFVRDHTKGEARVMIVPDRRH